MKEIYNTVEELLLSEDDTTIIHIFESDDENFKFYKTINGFRGDKYFDLYFIEWENGKKEIQLTHTMEEGELFQELLLGEDLTITIL